MGFIIKLLYMALKPFKQPLAFQLNKVSKLIRAKVMGARSGAGPTHQNFKMVPANKKGTGVIMLILMPTFYIYTSTYGNFGYSGKMPVKFI